jgi:D-glycero-D-manno-heptose 1,7-bisphosphate phosphatase
MKKTVFLDRDGTIIVDKGYLADPDGVAFLPGAMEALQRLSEAGYQLIIITNQSVIGRRMASEADVRAVNRRMEDRLAEEGIRFAGIYLCPHHPDDECTCRKPMPGMINRAAHEHEADLAHSAMVGDTPRDVEAGERAGCALNILLGLEEGCAPDLNAAVDRILRRLA